MTHLTADQKEGAGFERSRVDRSTLQQIFIRVCRDSGFQLDLHRACALAAKIVGKHPLEIWMAMPSFDVMSRIATGTHPAACRDSNGKPAS